MTTSGGSIFLLVKKDRGERHAKGLQSRPLESCFYTGVRRGDVRRPYEFARVQFTRFRPARRRAGGVRFRGYAGKPGTTFFRQLVAESTASAGLMRTARSAAKMLALKE